MTALITPAPAVPNSEQPEDEFDLTYEAFQNWMASQLVPGLNAAIPVIDAAYVSAVAAVATAAYKGPWASLAGALAIPASVSHAGTVWVLTESVANVAAEVPGVSTKWIAVSGAPVFVTMTPALAQGIFSAIAASDAAVFAAAEVHRVAMEASADPAAYDFSADWPPSIEDEAHEAGLAFDSSLL